MSHWIQLDDDVQTINPEKSTLDCKIQAPKSQLQWFTGDNIPKIGKGCDCNYPPYSPVYFRLHM